MLSRIFTIGLCMTALLVAAPFSAGAGSQSAEASDSGSVMPWESLSTSFTFTEKGNLYVDIEPGLGTGPLTYTILGPQGLVAEFDYESPADLNFGARTVSGTYTISISTDSGIYDTVDIGLRAYW